MTCSSLEVDFFNFDWYVHVYNYFNPERVLIKIEDMSYDKETVPISCVNRYDTTASRITKSDHN